MPSGNVQPLNFNAEKTADSRRETSASRRVHVRIGGGRSENSHKWCLGQLRGRQNQRSLRKTAKRQRGLVNRQSPSRSQDAKVGSFIRRVSVQINAPNNTKPRGPENAPKELGERNSDLGKGRINAGLKCRA